jgi:uncharacterized membrane protein
MKTRWMWLYLSGLVAVAFLAELAWYYPRLPQQVPLHFNWAGQPDGWGSKGELLGVSLGLLGFVAVLLSVGLCLVLYLPARLINMPHRDYWLAPERAEVTRRMLVDRTGWISCATILLLVAALHSSLHAPFQQPPKMFSPLVSLVLFLVFVAIWLAELWWRFSHARD